MFQACPHIHRDGAQLNFNRHLLSFLRQAHRNGSNQMQASIPIRLRMFDIVLLLQKNHPFLAKEHIRNIVHVFHVATNNAHTCNVHQLGQVFRLGGISPAGKLLKRALHRLQSTFNMMNGVVSAEHRKLVIQHFKLGAHRFHRPRIPRLLPPIFQQKLFRFFNGKIVEQFVFRFRHALSPCFGFPSPFSEHRLKRPA